MGHREFLLAVSNPTRVEACVGSLTSLNFIFLVNENAIPFFSRGHVSNLSQTNRSCAPCQVPRIVHFGSIIFVRNKIYSCDSRGVVPRHFFFSLHAEGLNM